MLSMPSEHPDLEDFITVKSDLNKLTKANLSVMASDAFMQAVIDNEDYELSFTRETGERISKTVNAGKVFDKIVKNNWGYGEPGLLFWDKIKNWNMLSEYPGFKFEGINPCQPLGEYVNTSKGFIKIENVSDHVILNGNKYESSKIIKTGYKEVFKVILENGVEVRMTGNHKISTPSGDKELQTLNVKDKVCVDYTPVFNTEINDTDEYEKGIIAGWFVADGGYCVSTKKCTARFAVGIKEFEYKDTLESLIKKHVDENFKFIPHNQKPKTCMIGSITAKDNRQKLSDILQINTLNKFNIKLEGRSKEFKLGFLRAVFTCDGSAHVNEYVLLCSINKDFMRTVQRLLIEFGIYSTLTLHNNARSYIAKDGKRRNNKTVWKVGIYDRVFNDVGFLTDYKQKYMLSKRQTNGINIINKKKQLKIRNVKSVGIMPVYDINVSDVHHYNTNCLIVHNCGELPLPAYGACCLGSFNLLAYIDRNAKTGKYFFRWHQFEQDISIAVNAMNKILDEGLPLHPLEEQRKTVAKWRQIGIGIMGFSSALMLLGVKYGSQTSLFFADAIGSMLIDEAVIASAELAKKEGPYPAYNFEYVSKSEFYKHTISSKAKRAIEKYGLRNSQLLSIAPTGSLSTLLSCSGGIEPLFAIKYDRKTESLNGKSISYSVYDPVVQTIMQENKIVDERYLPDYIITSTEIDPIDRVRMQAIWQKYIDASISSTVNLPETATLDDIKNIYIESWKQGLKGITVFRSGCAREGILSVTKNEEYCKEDFNGDQKMADACNFIHKLAENSNKDKNSEKISENTKQIIIRYMDSQMSKDFEEYESIIKGLERGKWKPIAPDTLYHPVKINIGCGTIKLFVGYSEHEHAIQDFELRISGSGGCERSLQDLVITMSGIIRLGGTIDNISKAFKGVRGCNSFAVTRTKGKRTLSSGDNCGNAILHAIKTFCDRMKKKEELISQYENITVNEHGSAYSIKDIYGVPVVVSETLMKPKTNSKNIICKVPACPECKSPMTPESGCFTCKSCGYSRCG